MRKSNKLPATLALLTAMALILWPLCGPLCASAPCATGGQTEAAECHGAGAVDDFSSSQQAIGAVKNCALTQLPAAKLSEDSPQTEHGKALTAYIPSHQRLLRGEASFSNDSPEICSRAKLKNYLATAILRI